MTILIVRMKDCDGVVQTRHIKAENFDSSRMTLVRDDAVRRLDDQ